MKKVELTNLPKIWRDKVLEEQEFNSNDPLVNGNSQTVNNENQFRHTRVISKIEENKKLKKPNSVQDFHNFFYVLVGELDVCNKSKILFRNILGFIRNQNFKYIPAGYLAFYETHKDLVDRAASIKCQGKLTFKEAKDGKYALVPVKRKSASSKNISDGKQNYYKKCTEQFRNWLTAVLNDKLVKNNPTYITYIKMMFSHNNPEHSNIPAVYRPVLKEYFEQLQNFTVDRGKLVKKQVQSIKLEEITISKMKEAHEQLQKKYDRLYILNMAVLKQLQMLVRKYDVKVSTADELDMIAAIDMKLFNVTSELTIKQQLSNAIDIKSFVAQLKEQNVKDFNVSFNSNNL